MDRKKTANDQKIFSCINNVHCSNRICDIYAFNTSKTMLLSEQIRYKRLEISLKILSETLTSTCVNIKIQVAVAWHGIVVKFNILSVRQGLCRIFINIGIYIFKIA